MPSILTVLSLLVFTTLAHAATYETSPGNLTQALARIRAGDTLVLTDGVYTQPLAIPASASGTPSLQTTITVTKGATVTVPQLDLAVDGPTQYLTITGAGGTLIVDGDFRVDTVVNSRDTHHIRMQAVEVRRSRGNGILVGGSSCETPVHDLEFLGLNVHDNGYDAGGGRNFCLATDGNAGFCHGIYVGDHCAYGILIDGGEYHHNEGTGIHLYSGGHTVRNVKAYGNYHGNGIWPIEGRGHVIVNNLAYGNKNFGIWAGGTGDYAHNTLYGNGLAGILVKGPGSTIRNNISAANREGPISDESGGSSLDHNLTSDPGFRNPSAGDFGLARDDNGGVRLAEVPTDLAGTARQTPSDRGACEYGSPCQSGVGGTIPPKPTRLPPPRNVKIIPR